MEVVFTFSVSYAVLKCHPHSPDGNTKKKKEKKNPRTEDIFLSLLVINTEDIEVPVL